MVKALHRAGIEVILDVVFNHTAEGGHGRADALLRGIDNPTYYILEMGAARYANYTGCGNTLNANNPVVRRMIVDSLRYWVSEMHVDGFRFDLASILSRDSNGQVLPNPPVLWDIESDPALAGTKLIAEAWDAAGLYQVGSFVGDTWKEWNGRFRDDVRDFFRGEPGSLGRFADRLLGARRFMVTKAAKPSRASTSSPAMTDSRSTIWFHTTKNTTRQRRRQPRRRERQPELELRGRRTDRRPGGGGTTQPAGEELFYCQPYGTWYADDPDGRRGSAHARRKQQRLLP